MARLLGSLERQDSLAVGCRAFSQAKNVIELFAEMRASLSLAIFNVVKPELAPETGASPFCVIHLDGGTLPESYEDIHQDDQRELFCALRRKTGNQQPNWPEFNKRRFMEIGLEGGTGDKSGWTLSTVDGMATRTGQGNDPDHASRARLCNHRNVAKLIGFYRLYHSYINYLDQRGKAEMVSEPILEHAVNALDRMRINYSMWWIRWATTRREIGLEEPVASLVKEYKIERRLPPHQKAPTPTPLAPQTELSRQTVYIYKPNIMTGDITKQIITGGTFTGPVAANMKQSTNIINQQPPGRKSGCSKPCKRRRQICLTLCRRTSTRRLRRI